MQFFGDVACSSELCIDRFTFGKNRSVPFKEHGICTDGTAQIKRLKTFERLHVGRISSAKKLC